MTFTVFTGLFQNVIVLIVSNHEGNQKDKATIIMLQKIGLYFTIFTSLILLLLGRYFSQLFDFRSPYFFGALALLLISGVLASTYQGIIQGLHHFKALSVYGIISAATKVAFAFVLVLLGFNILGAISGLVLSNLFGLAFAYFYSRKHFPLGNGFKVAIDWRIKKELWYAFLVFCSSLSVTFLYSADTIVIRRYFPVDTAGYYSGIATIGRIIYFLTSSIAGVLLPSIKLKNSVRQNRKTLLKGTALVALIGGLTWLTFYFFPAIITEILIGSRYKIFASLLPKIGLFLLVISLVNLLFYYLLALRSNFLILAAASGPLAILVLSTFRHGTPEMIISNFLIGGLLALILAAGKILAASLKRNKYEEINIGSDTGL